MTNFQIIKEQRGKRSQRDARIKCDWYLVSYEVGGAEYRKSFEFKQGKPFTEVTKYIADYMSFMKP